MRLIAALLLFAVASVSMAGEYRQSPRNKQIAVQVQKAQAYADGSAVINEAPAAKIPDPAAIAPNPSAPAPSAQCRYGWGVTGAVPAFGAGITASEWDEICGLWLAAQQTSGDARSEAAAAAFCLTMKKAKVHSPTCKDWQVAQSEGRDATVTKVVMNENQADIRFGGAGGWN